MTTNNTNNTNTDTDILAILEDFKNDGKNKIERLTKHKKNELLRTTVFLALDPFTQFYQRKIPKYTAKHVTLDLEDALTKLNAMSSRQVTGNAAISYLTHILESLHPDDAKVIERVVQKNLDCGIQAATANKIWPGLVKEYPCMLVDPFNAKNAKWISYPAIVQVKMDGMRFNAIVTTDDYGLQKVEFRSRNGKELVILGYLEQDFIKMANGKNVVYDGELLCSDPESGVSVRQTANGVISKTIKGTITDKEAKNIYAVIWDRILLIDFRNGYSKEKYTNRLQNLIKDINKFYTESSVLVNDQKVKLITTHQVQSLDEAQKIFQQYLDRGEEGIILKDQNGPWEDKRVNHQLKMKAEIDCDLLITGIEMGTGRMSNMLGAFVCQSSDGVINVSVGSGFTDAQRVEYLKGCIGKIVTIKYNARIRNVKGEETLFLPIFKEIREDKTVADDSKKIK